MAIYPIPAILPPELPPPPRPVPGVAGTLAKPKSFEERLLPPEALQRKQTGEQLGRLEANFSQMRTTAGNILGYTEAFGDETLKERAFDHAFEMLGRDAPPQRIGELAKHQFEQLQNARDKELNAKRATLWRAAQEGGLLNITDVTDIEAPQLRAIVAMAEESDASRIAEILSGREDLWSPDEQAKFQQYVERGPPDKIPGFLKPLHAINTPARMLQSGTAAAIETFREQAPEPPPQQALQQRIVEAIQTGAGPAETAEKLIPVFGEALYNQAIQALTPYIEKIRQAGTATREFIERGEAETGRMRTALSVPSLVAGAGGLLEQTPKGRTLAGVPGHQAAGMLADPEVHAKTAAGYAKGLVEGLSFEQHARLEKTLQQIADELGPEATQEDFLAIALEHPTITQTAHEMALDPYNLIGGWVFKGPLKGAAFVGRGAAKAAMKVPPIAAGVEKVKPLVRVIKEAFTWFPEAKELEKAGLQEVADKMVLAWSEGQLPQREVAKIARRVQKLEGLVKTDADKALLQKALDGRLFTSEEWLEDLSLHYDDVVEATRGLLPEHLHAAFDESRALADDLYKVGVETKTLRRWKAGELAEAEPRQLYVPHREMTEEAAAELAKRTATKAQAETTPLRQLRQRAALKRMAPAEAFVQDPVRQFRRATQDLAKRAGPAEEMKKLGEYFASKRVWSEAPADIGKEGYILRIPKKLSEKKRVAMLDDLARQTPDIEWGTLGKELRDVHLQVTGEVGMPMGKFDVMAPKPMIERMRQLAPVALGGKNGPSKAADSVDSFMKLAVRPFMHTFRTGTTILGGPLHFIRDLTGAIGLGALAHKFRLLSPNLQKGAVLGTLASAGIGEDWARAHKFMLSSGKELEIGEFLNLANRAGIVDQHDMRMGLETLMGQGPLGRGVQKLTETVSPLYVPLGKKLSARGVKRMIENYQHLVAFGGFLEDTTPTALARAMQLTSKYAGDYRRLAPFERYVLKDMFAFYSWSRFIMPHMAKQILDKPQVVNKFVQHRLAHWRAAGEDVPPSESLSAYLKLAGVPAPKQFQPSAVKIPGLGTRDYAIMTVEDLLTMGLTFVPVLSSLFGRETGGLTLGEQTSPMLQFAIEAITRRDFRTGEDIDTFGMLDSAQLARDLGFMTGISEQRRTAIGNLLVAPVRRPSQNLMNLYRLYFEEAKKPEEAADLALRYKVGRDFWIFANVFNILGEMAYEREIPGAIVSPIPGTGVYPVNVTKEAARQSGRATQRMRRRTRQLVRE